MRVLEVEGAFLLSDIQILCTGQELRARTEKERRGREYSVLTDNALSGLVLRSCCRLTVGHGENVPTCYVKFLPLNIAGYLCLQTGRVTRNTEEGLGKYGCKGSFLALQLPGSPHALPR